MTPANTRRPIIFPSCHPTSATVWLIAAAFAIGVGDVRAASTDPTGKSELVRKLEAVFHNDAFASIPGKRFPASDYGAKADGRTVNTKAIQAAIDAAHEDGGGVVTLPQGTTLSGALFLKSNVELRIGEGVILQAVEDIAAYPETPTRIAGIEMGWPAALINIAHAENVRVTGPGVIDGSGPHWWKIFCNTPQ